MLPKTLAKNIAKLTFTKKAFNIVILNLRNLTDITDYFVICSADSDTQAKAIADAVISGIEKKGLQAWHIEGLTERQWIIIDYVDVVLHIFLKEVRKFYNLEKLWGDAIIEIVEDKPTKKTIKSKPQKKDKVEKLLKK